MKQPFTLPRNIMTGLPEQLADAINEQLSVVTERLQAASGGRGTTHMAAQLNAEANKIINHADPTENMDGVNLRTLLRFRECEFLVQILEQCNDFGEVVDDHVETGGVAPVELSYFFGYSVVAPRGTTSSGLGAVNEVKGWGFALPLTITVNRITFEQTSGSGGAYSAGLYSSDKALLLTSGTFSAGLGVKSADVSPVELTPNEYILGFCTNGSGFRVMSSVSGGLGLRNAFEFLNQNGNRQGTDGITGSSGLLPATLGTLTGDLTLPPIVLFESIT